MPAGHVRPPHGLRPHARSPALGAGLSPDPEPCCRRAGGTAEAHMLPRRHGPARRSRCRAPRRRRDRHPTTGTRLCPAPGPPRSAGTLAVSDIIVLGSVLPWKMAEGPGSPTSSSGSGPLPTPPELEGQHEAGAPPRAHPAQSRTFLLARQCPQHSPWGPGPTGEASPEKPGVTAAPTQPCQSKGGHRGPRRAAPPCPPASQRTLVLGAQQQERVRDLGRGKGHQEQGQETGHTGDKPIKHRGLQDEAEPFPPHPPRAWPSR